MAKYPSSTHIHLNYLYFNSQHIGKIIVDVQCVGHSFSPCFFKNELNTWLTYIFDKFSLIIASSCSWTFLWHSEIIETLKRVWLLIELIFKIIFFYFNHSLRWFSISRYSRHQSIFLILWDFAFRYWFLSILCKP